MSAAEVLDLLQLAFWTVAVASAPPVLAAMTIGLAVALLQALTQVQEATLTFVPKIVAVLLVLSATGVFVGSSIQGLAEHCFELVSRAPQ